LELEWYLGYHNLSNLTGGKDSRIAVQGLKKVALSVEELDNDWSAAWGTTQREQTKKLCDELKTVFEEQMKQPRSTTYNLEKFRQAQIEANLDVHGEGRLSEDKKPGMVSSRTRQSARNVDKLAADGTLPDRDSPKYDLNGDLAWTISTIENCREVIVDGVPSVEFFIKGGPSIGVRYRRIQEGKEQEFWEDISTLNSMHCRHSITEFYHKNPKEIGMRVVLDVWKLRNLEDDREDKNKVQTEKRLEAMINQQVLVEQWEAEQAAQAARQAAKDLKAAKTSKKAKKVKAAVGRR
jgi:hypothetical protein